MKALNSVVQTDLYQAVLFGLYWVQMTLVQNSYDIVSPCQSMQVH